MSLTGARNSMALFPRPASTFPRSPPVRGPNAPKSRRRNTHSMSEQIIHSAGIIMNGVTGRMGLNQHLRRSIYAIVQQGGVKLGPAEVIMPKPILVGRNPAKLEAISAECGGLPWSTDLDKTLANSE